MMELTERFGMTRQTIGRRLRSRGVDTSRAEIVKRIKARRRSNKEDQ
ncbi:hypothetical protein [Kribbella swartbergensis]